MKNTAKNLSIRDRVAEVEWQTRVDLAACYRLIALFGWDDLIFTHISARVPGPHEHFLINAYGLLFEEMSASSLVKVDLSGEKVLETPHLINPAGFTIHSAIHEARADVGCVIHTHTKAGVAVSTQAGGLLPLSQVSLFPLASMAYHDYEGIALNEAEKPRLVADLGDRSNMILRNHGLLTVAADIPDAFLSMYVLETACQTQLLAQSAGTPMTMISSEILAGIRAQVQQVTKGLGGKLAWPGLLRKLDRQDSSFRN
jgi:ribulose-5-phosphate 4-epimerase/fuculose-1-phosphate aldolase